MANLTNRDMPKDFVEIQMALLDAIERADRTGAQALLRTWAAAHRPERLLVEVIEPVLAWIGEGWRRHESFTIAQGYIAKLPAIIFSGFAASDRVNAALAMGSCDFLAKPVSLDDCARAVQSALAGTSRSR